MPPVEEPDTYTALAEPSAAERRKRLRRLVTLVILISIGVHLVAGVGAGIWVIARYFSQPKAQFVAQKKVKLEPEDRQHRLQMEELSALRPKPVYDNRIQSLRPSQLALPELPTMPVETMVPLDTEALVTGAVEGVGVSGQGEGSGGGFFGGAVDAGAGLLEGTLYDFKLRANGLESEIVPSREDIWPNTERYKKIISRALSAGLRESSLRNYFQVPKKLYLAQLAIPPMNADAAPKAFESDIKPQFWAIIYRGQVSPPRDGTYRFAGSADDVIIVRFNNRIVLEGSLEPARITPWETDEPMSHRGGWGPEFGEAKRHVVYGDWINMKAGQFYPIEILIGEVPGSVFYANLHIQEKGVEYPKGPDDTPILPLFRVQDIKPPANPLRPIGPDGPVFSTKTSRRAAELQSGQ